MHDLSLEGCRPVPLAHYLKALGVLRLVAEQKDPAARGFWRRDSFVLRSELDRDGLERFFLEEYRPTPIVGPWGARSGFYPDPSEKAARTALQQIKDALDARFTVLTEATTIVEAILDELGIKRKEQVEARKHDLMELCRAKFPDEAVAWLDTCFVLFLDGERFPPLLGTGGNEGSGSYMSGFMQQLAACLVRREHDHSLPAALWGVNRAGALDGQTPGHFIPNAGGANISPGFGQKPHVNPWDYLLCLEGTPVFASAASRRFETLAPSRTASFPFTVESSAAGYSTAVVEKNRGEIWLPVWSNPSSHNGVVALFSEGRATVGNRAVRDGLDFVRAVVSLGVDRGIERFYRFGFQERNGQNNFAVPLGAVEVRPQSNARLLGDIDVWLGRFRQRAKGPSAPASAMRALRQLESSIFEMCVRGDSLRLQQVLVALGRCERVMATSARWTSDPKLSPVLQPVPALSPDWLRQIDDNSVELRLAASLGSVFGYYGSEKTKETFLPLRRQLEPVTSSKSDVGLRVRWDFEAGRDVVWTPGHLCDALNSILHRRLVAALQAGATTYPDRGRLPASLGDIADFIEGRVDDQRLSELLWGCILLDWSRMGAQDLSRRNGPRIPLPTGLYALLKLCFAGPSRRRRSEKNDAATSETDSVDVPIDLRIHRLASAGRGAEASREAIRRLRGSGFAPAVTPLEIRGDIARRSAAALLFPISERDRWRLQRIVTRPEPSGETEISPETETSSGVVT